jgi:hypothetical protein
LFLWAELLKCCGKMAASTGLDEVAVAEESTSSGKLVARLQRGRVNSWLNRLCRTTGPVKKRGGR